MSNCQLGKHHMFFVFVSQKKFDRPFELGHVRELEEKEEKRTEMRECREVCKRKVRWQTNKVEGGGGREENKKICHDQRAPTPLSPK